MDNVWQCRMEDDPFTKSTRESGGAASPWLPEMYVAVEDHPWVVTMRERMKAQAKTFADDIFLCHNRLFGDTFIALWEYRPSGDWTHDGSFIGLEPLQGYITDPDAFPWGEYLDYRFRPHQEHVDEARRRLAADESETVGAMMESQEQAQDIAKHYKKKGMDSTARAYAGGDMPFISEREFKHVTEGRGGGNPLTED